MRKDLTSPVLKDTQLVLQKVREQLAPHPEWAEAVKELDTVLRQLEALISDAQPGNRAYAYEIIRNCIDIFKVLKDIAELVSTLL